MTTECVRSELLRRKIRCFNASSASIAPLRVASAAICNFLKLITADWYLAASCKSMMISAWMVMAISSRRSRAMAAISLTAYLRTSENGPWRTISHADNLSEPRLFSRKSKTQLSLRSLERNSQTCSFICHDFIIAKRLPLLYVCHKRGRSMKGGYDRSNSGKDL